MGDSSHGDGCAFLRGVESQGTEQAAASLFIHHDTDPALPTSARPSSTQQLPQPQGYKRNSSLGHLSTRGERGNIVPMHPGRSCPWHDPAELSGNGAAPAQVLAEVCRCGDREWGAHEVWAGFASQELILIGNSLKCCWRCCSLSKQEKTA